MGFDLPVSTSAVPPDSVPTSSLYKQESQHPLTGQRAANFRLLANQ